MVGLHNQERGRKAVTGRGWKVNGGVRTRQIADAPMFTTIFAFLS
jgi:hypothetical protein